MALPNVNINDPHVVAHNTERAEINALRTIADALPSNYVRRSLNLSDLASALTARNNLGIVTDSNRIRIGNLSIDWGIHQVSYTNHPVGQIRSFVFNHGSVYTGTALFATAIIDNWVTGTSQMIVKQASGETTTTSEFTILNSGGSDQSYTNLPVRWLTIGSV